jgi:hypothetical protein
VFTSDNNVVVWFTIICITTLEIKFIEFWRLLKGCLMEEKICSITGKGAGWACNYVWLELAACAMLLLFSLPLSLFILLLCYSILSHGKFHHASVNLP